jgi:hypothetical protein
VTVPKVTVIPAQAGIQTVIARSNATRQSRGFAFAPGHAAHLPWIATPFGLAMTVKGRRAPDDDSHMVDDDGIPGFRPAPE